MHLNLARVLEKVDAKSALEEYRIASTLAPDNATIKAAYERFEHAVTATAEQAATGAAIKVEVRQVLVPVVVRDKDGHHVSGLTQADFHVLEDGVERRFPASPSRTPAPVALCRPLSEASLQALRQYRRRPRRWWPGVLI